MPSKAEQLFALKAPWIMELLMRDFSLDLDSAAAILGNLGHECGGFSLMQEQEPTVKGSAGGYGWAQWTGPRRREFEAYCTRNNLDPKEDRANYGWLFVELSTSEKRAIAAVKKPGSVADKVKAFELAFERAGVKHYPSRNAWAARAIAAYKATPGIPTLPEWAKPGKPTPQPAPPEPVERPPVPFEPWEPDRAPAPAQPAKRGILAIILEFLASLFRKAPQ